MPPVAKSLLEKIMSNAVTPFLYFMFALAIVIFLWGIMEFIYSSDDEKKKEDGKRHLVWGLVGMFIMFGVWGIIKIIQNFVDSF